MKKRSLKIVMIGTRGVPAKYGGFETCVERIGQRLVQKGHEVTVYCRKGYYQKKLNNYLGMKLVYFPNIKRKAYDTLSHTFLCSVHAIFQPSDVSMVFNAANSLFILPLKLIGKRIIINTDGLEWKRSKWGGLGRLFFKFSEKLACIVANRLVSDSEGIKQYYWKAHNSDSTKIAYGADVMPAKSSDRLHDFGLRPNEYFLQVTRFEPENHPLLTIRAFKEIDTDKKLVLVGGNPYQSEYTQMMELERNGKIILTGFIYDQRILAQLWAFSYAYIHGNSVGGTNPALLQAMANGCFIMAFDNTFNREVLDDCGIYYSESVSSLSRRMKWAIDNRQKLSSYKERAKARIREHYSWETVTDQYEKLFIEVSNNVHKWRPKMSRIISFS